VLPRGGEKIALDRLVERAGGQVATAALAAARLGLEVGFIGAVGDDAAGDASLAPLRAAGVDLQHVRTLPGVESRQALVLVEAEGGERTVLGHRNPALLLEADAASPGAVTSSRALLVDAEHPAASRRAAAIARSAGIPVVCDVDRVEPESVALIREVDFPIVSNGFAEQFSRNTSPEEALRALCAPGVRMAVVTLGERGAVARVDGRVLRCPARDVAALDTTGAGDVFRGAFVWELLRGGSAETVLRTACAAAALACRKLGAQSALPDAAELEAFLSN
jgi:sulfofructose kinase